MKSAFMKTRRIPALLSKLSEAVLFALGRVSPLIPYYHAVSDDQPAHFKHIYRVRSVSQFKQDLEVLLKRYRPISLQDLLQSLDNAREPQAPTCLFTFDDGF